MWATALWLLFGGFCFAFFSFPAFGIDLLLDPVGFLLAANALMALRRQKLPFSACTVVALLLTAVAALQLFWPQFMPLVGLHLGGEAALFILLRRGLAEIWDYCDRAAGRLATSVGLYFAAFTRLAALAGALFPLPALRRMAPQYTLAGSLAVLLLVAFTALLGKPQRNGEPALS